MSQRKERRVMQEDIYFLAQTTKSYIAGVELETARERGQVKSPNGELEGPIIEERSETSGVSEADWDDKVSVRDVDSFGRMNSKPLQDVDSWLELPGKRRDLDSKIDTVQRLGSLESLTPSEVWVL